MGSFTNGVLVGVGLSLLIAPKTGKEMRQLAVERFNYLRGIPPENEELKQSMQQMAQRVQSVQQKAEQAAQMGTTAQTYAQQTARSAQSVQSDLSNVAQQAGTDVPQTKQDPTTTRELNPRRNPRP
ncbi:MAG: hypothetical protein M3Z24_13620 [Chloroflexota bacterium]|nr:hypothetical protein [Chloroflexota bacterium]